MRVSCSLSSCLCAVTAAGGLIASSTAWADPSIDAGTISWPADGWYQVQDAETYESLCEGGSSCDVSPGRYIVINHTTGVRYEDILVTASADGTNTELIEAQARNSFLNLGLPTTNIDSLGSRIGESNAVVSYVSDLDRDGSDELVFRDYGADPSHSGVLRGNVSLADVSTVDLIAIEPQLLPAAVLDFTGDGHPDRVTGSLAGADRVYSGFALQFSTTFPVEAALVVDGQLGIRIDGVEPGQLSGARLPVGDMNGDGFDDLAILPRGVVSRAGAALHILYGRPSFPVSQLDISQLVPDAYGEQLLADEGFRFETLIPLGDINDDGFDDLALGYREQAKRGGGPYDSVIVFGSTERRPGDVRTVAGEFKASRLTLFDGVEVRRRVGDLNADGQQELLVEIERTDQNRATETVLNTSTLTPGERYSAARLDSQFVQINIDDQLIDLWPAGDVDGDGYGDLLIEEFAVGNLVLVYAGTFAGESAIDAEDLSSASSALFSSNTPYVSSSSADGNFVSVSYAYSAIAGGDLNGDGFSDLVFQLSRFYRESVQDELIVLPGGPR